MALHIDCDSLPLATSFGESSKHDTEKHQSRGSVTREHDLVCVLFLLDSGFKMISIARHKLAGIANG